MHFGRDAAVGAGAAGIAEHEHKKHHRRRGLVETRRTKPTLMTRLRGPNANTQTVKTTTTIEPDTSAGLGGGAVVNGGTTRRSGRFGGRRSARTGGGVGIGSGAGAGVGAGVGTNRTRRSRRNGPTLGDKVSGAMLKLKGTLTNNPRDKVRS